MFALSFCELRLITFIPNLAKYFRKWPIGSDAEEKLLIVQGLTHLLHVMHDVLSSLYSTGHTISLLHTSHEVGIRQG